MNKKKKERGGESKGEGRKKAREKKKPERERERELRPWDGGHNHIWLCHKCGDLGTAGGTTCPMHRVDLTRIYIYEDLYYGLPHCL